MGRTQINRLVSKNFIKTSFALTLFLALLSNAARASALEVVEATTVIPKDKLKGQTERFDVTRGAKLPILNILKEKKEFSIPNPLDEWTIRRIKETNRAASSEVKTASKNSDLTIDSKMMEYFDTTGELVAKGNVTITSKTGTTVTADRAVYNRNANILKLFDNVILKMDDNIVNGDYMVIDLNEENALMDEPEISVGTLIRIKAQEGYAYSDRIEAVNGNAELAKKMELCLKTSGFETIENMSVPTEEVSFELKKERLSPYKIRAKEIIVESKKDHDVFTIKNADIYYKKLKVATAGSIELFADKEMNYIEANIPVEIGSISDFGQYAGMGYIFKLPNGGNLKVAPALVYDDEIGVGVISKLKTKRLNLEAAWATSSENLILDGRYDFTDNLRFDFARHAYKDEWFLGSKRPGHLAQLVYDDEYPVRDINATFSQRFTMGYVSDYLEEHQERDNKGTMRFRWQSQLVKNLFEISNKEQDMSLRLGVSGDTTATVYGTGETFGLVRGGPFIESRIKNWKSYIDYKIGGVHGRSPFEFDEYTYGKSSISIQESFKLTKYLSVAYRGTISPLKDNSDDDLMTENRVYVVAGPDDVKVAVSYDTIRKNAYFDVMFMLGADNANVSFDKFTVKDPEKIGKKEQKFGQDLKYYRVKVPENL